MTFAQRALLPLATGTFALLTSVPAWCDEPRGELELVAEAADETSRPGEPLLIAVALRNSGHEPLEVYHPPSIHRASACWSLTCRVTPPDGDVLTLAPEITFANAPVERREHFRRLGPGEAVRIEVRLRADDPSATHTPSGWVGLVPISRGDLELLTESEIKRRHGVRGEVFFISGRETQLAIRDLLGDVFDRPGEYRLDFEYENQCTRYWDLTTEGKSALRTVQRAWSGRLSTRVVITIEGP